LDYLKGGIFYYALYDGDYPRATSDIDFLAHNISNDPDRIKAVFREIFLLPDIDEIVAFDEEYANDPLRVSRWNNFAKKKKISLNVSLEDAITLIKEFLAPIITAMQEGDGYEGHWDSNKREWML